MHKAYRTFLTGMLIIALLGGCAEIWKQYTYQPQQPNEVPASIQFEDKPAPILLAQIHMVNGGYVVNSLDEPKAAAVQDNQILLSPGTNRLLIWVSNNKVGGTLPVNLDAKPGEKYRLCVENNTLSILTNSGTVINQVKYRKKMIIR